MLINDMDVPRIRKEGLSGVLWYFLKKNDIAIDIAEADRLHHDFYIIVRNNLYLFYKLRLILKSLAEINIHPIVFRGMSLLGDVYPDFGMRPILDIDLLIKKDELDLAKQTLKRHRLISDKKGISLRSDLVIDLHTGIFSPSSIWLNRPFLKYTERFFEMSRWKELDGLKFRVPCPEHTILSLAAHMQHHSFERLLGLYDIYMVLDKYGDELDRDILIADAKEMNLLKTIDYVFYLMPCLSEFFSLTGQDKWKADRYFPVSDFNRFEKRILGAVKERRYMPFSGQMLFVMNMDGYLGKLQALLSIIFQGEGPIYKKISDRASKALQAMRALLFHAMLSF